MSEKWNALVELLIRLSSDNKLEWRETSDSETFQTKIGQNVIEMEGIEDNTEYYIRIYDRAGKVIDGFSGLDIMKESGRNWRQEIFDLFRNIKRQNSGADRVLDSILSQLIEKDDDVPF